MERGKRQSARIVDLHLDCKKPPDQKRQTDKQTDRQTLRGWEVVFHVEGEGGKGSVVKVQSKVGLRVMHVQ